MMARLLDTSGRIVAGALLPEEAGIRRDEHGYYVYRSELPWRVVRAHTVSRRRAGKTGASFIWFPAREGAKSMSATGFRAIALDARA